ncbi:hypothetical protein LI82_06705 [Methanococcoides methylutens]|uniref:DUF1638 domain-containing protein n=1 Tax=Methanococcoides methylutens TaxID=2226 RepID=A0A099T2X8_METMT|nr:DUF1638 domain-containing protein [Methanococcoides methylutens]KGK98561.1 hypothetical protein LI82_06705 [Methanococcoides methylutens]
MPVISLIGCRMFEDEIVHLVEHDPLIDNLIIVENKDCAGIVEKLDDIGVSYKLVPESKLASLYSEQCTDSYCCIINILEFALHAIPTNLKSEVYAKVEEMAPYSEGILLFYGLCGNVLGDVEKDLEDIECKICILKEENGEIIDDCIGAVLGGREAYLHHLKSFKGIGTFFLTPMWAANWGDMLVAGGFGKDPNDTETSKFVFDAVGYKKVAKLDTGLRYEKKFDDIVKEFAEIFDFDILNIEGELGLIEGCYRKFRNEVLKREQ